MSFMLVKKLFILEKIDYIDYMTVTCLAIVMYVIYIYIRFYVQKILFFGVVNS